MKQFFLKFQLLFEAAILLATLILVYVVIQPFHERWDLTQDKVYSLPPATTGVLQDLKNRRIDLLLFFAQDDPARKGLEVFLKECSRHHPEFHYDFYDPNRRPQLARKFNVSVAKTVIFRSGDREERLVGPTEEAFTNAFLRLLHPKDLDVCFVTGHGEVDLDDDATGGYRRFRDSLQGYNAKVHGVVLTRDHVPAACQVVVVGGPRWDLTAEEFADLDKAFQERKGVLLLIDPMDPGQGGAFLEFAQKHGVALGQNVVVDKVSRMVGGDFLMPLVSRYLVTHPVTKSMKQATFFPLVRTVQPSTDVVPGLDVVPLAMTGEGSWGETDLPALENGNASFDMKTDVAGPLPIAVAVEKKQDDVKPDAIQSHGRMIIVGDSDFLTNGYLDLSGNKELGLNMVRWLASDDRFMDVKRPELRFKPLLLDVPHRTQLMILLLGVYPLTVFVLGGIYLGIRSRTS